MMHHKTLSSSNAKELIRIVTTYQNLSVEQLLRYFPHMGEDTFSRLADRLSKEGRIYYDKAARRLLAARDIPENPELSAAFWVLLDFIDQTSYHTVGELPAAITMFYENEVYDICYAAPGKEVLMNQLFSAESADTRTKKLVIIEDIKQMKSFSSLQITAFCKVDADGNTQYYKRQGG